LRAIEDGLTTVIRKTLNLDDGSVSYLEWPSDRPALHFAHANGLNSRTYSSLLAPLASQFHIFASDMRGHGFSTLPADPKRLKDWRIYATDLSRVLDNLAAQPIILAGHSMGAIASLMFAAMHPARVCALVLVEPALTRRPSIGNRIVRLFGRDSLSTAARRARKRREVFPTFDDAVHSYRERGMFANWPEGIVRDYLQGGLIPTGRGEEVRLSCAPSWEASNFVAAPHDLSRYARHVGCPMTVMYAEGGPLGDVELNALLKNHGQARLVKVPATTHFLPLQKPEAVREEIARLRGSIPPPVSHDSSSLAVYGLLTTGTKCRTSDRS
jgi:pimeloyl-ACP methyl ester carboxylesterase